MWNVQRQKRPTGDYYSAVRKAEGRIPARSVTVGKLEGNPEPAPLTARLRSVLARVATAGLSEPADEVIRDVVRCASDFDAGLIMAAALIPTEGTIEQQEQGDVVPGPAPLVVPVVAPVPVNGNGDIVPGTVEAYLTLVEYHERYFWPARTGLLLDRDVKVIARKSRTSDGGRYDLILASGIGNLRLVDLDRWKWNAYLNNLTAGPRTRALHQAAYRAILVYAHRKGHIRNIHEFFPIFGAASVQNEKEDPLGIE
ncbi:MAG: hypothetical protein H0V89_11020, partial [Deltaproteobacteria bacterium]|nr:hypothetical protein [Deltaproteobacteria bacterium]